MSTRIWTRLSAAIVSSAYVFSYSRVSWMVNQGFLLTSFEIIAPTVFLLSLRNQRILDFALLVSVSVGVAAAVGVDVAMDPKPRNLFPIEMLLWLIMMAPSIAVGAVAGYFADPKRSASRKREGSIAGRVNGDGGVNSDAKDGTE